MTYPPHEGEQPPGRPYAPQRPTPYPHPRQGASPYGPPPYSQPPYGPYLQPPYGQPPYGPPPRERRTGLIVSLVLLAVLVAAAAVVLPRIVAPRVLSRSATERDVAQQFEERQGVAITLRCDDTMTLRTGAVYHCRGTTAQNEHVTITIRITDGATARYTWGT